MQIMWWNSQTQKMQDCDSMIMIAVEADTTQVFAKAFPDQLRASELQLLIICMTESVDAASRGALKTCRIDNFFSAEMTT